jgi:hypothetical protein
MIAEAADRQPVAGTVADYDARIAKSIERLSTEPTGVALQADAAQSAAKQ